MRRALDQDSRSAEELCVSEWRLENAGRCGAHQPVWLRQGTTLLVGNNETQVDYDYEQDIRLVLGASGSDSELATQLRSSKNATKCNFKVTRRGQSVSIETTPERSNSSVQLPWDRCAWG
jgi:hypothetical protein